MAEIALVDDDQNILTSVSIALEAEGHTTRTYTDGASALAALKLASADLAILDIKMPRMDGMELFHQLRKISKLPIIFLTSKAAEVDEIVGLKIGADDFITKPFSQKVLNERVKTVLRRNKNRLATSGAGATSAAGATGGASSATGATSENSATSSASSASIAELTRQQNNLQYGDLVMDKARHICTWQGKHIMLTVTEFQLLLALAARPGIVKSREQLMNEAYENEIYVNDRTIDSHIKRLRKKFKSIDKNFEKIETLYGVGYRFCEN